MRCYFMRNGHIAAVRELPGLSDEEAVEQARDLFATHAAMGEVSAQKDHYDGFEVWDRSRMVIQHPAVVDLTEIPRRVAVGLGSKSLDER